DAEKFDGEVSWRHLLEFYVMRRSRLRRIRGTKRYGISGRQNHFGWIPANLITLPHFSVSSAMSLPKSAGEPGSTVPPRSAKRAFKLASARTALISTVSLSMNPDGVFFGACTPTHWLPSNPGTKSLTVGMSGSASERI